MFQWNTQLLFTNVFVDAEMKLLPQFRQQIGNFLLTGSPFLYVHQLEIGVFNASHTITLQTIAFTFQRNGLFQIFTMVGKRTLGKSVDFFQRDENRSLENRLIARPLDYPFPNIVRIRDLCLESMNLSLVFLYSPILLRNS